MRKYFKWNDKICIGIIVLAFILGFLVSNDYGTYIDQPIEEGILMQNMYEYLNYLPHIYLDNIISLSPNREHGTAPYYPLGIYFLFKIISPNGMNFPAGTLQLWHYYTFVLFFMGCIALYGIVYELFHSHKLSLVSFLFYYLSPRFFAQGHYNNKDIIMLTFGLMCIYFGIRYIREQKIRYGLLLALSAAFMTNVKILGAWFFAVPGITYLIVNLWKRQLNVSKFIDGMNIILAYFLIYAVITPALWKGPLAFIKYSLDNASSFSMWAGTVVYAGKSFHLPENPVPKDYLLLNILCTTPLILLFFSFVGHIRAIWAIIKKETNALIYAMVLVLNLVPYSYSLITENLVIYNGWRHFYFLYGGLLIFMAVGLKTILSFLKSQLLKYAFCTGILAYLLCLILMGHPFQYSYLNILAKRPAEKDWQLDYWDVGGIPVLTRLYQCQDRNRNLELTVTGATPLVYDMMFGCEWENEIRYIYPDERNETGERANYVICNLTYDTLPEEGYHLLFTVNAYGNCLYHVYETD